MTRFRVYQVTGVYYRQNVGETENLFNQGNLMSYLCGIRS